jgi:hypothetical protein
LDWKEVNGVLQGCTYKDLNKKAASVDAAFLSTMIVELTLQQERQEQQVQQQA